MNLFQKYGIKEVADVVFYSINRIGDEEFYTPVLFLDTLKVSSIEKTAEKVSAQGGKGNKKLITWNFGKEITLNLEDALFTPASMSMIWGGRLEAKLTPYTSAIVKINIANKYGALHYSTKAYPSPALTDEEWDIVFKAAQEIKLDVGTKDDKGNPNTDYYKENYTHDDPYIEQNRTELRKRYFKRLWYYENEVLFNATDGVSKFAKAPFTKYDFSRKLEDGLSYEEWLNAQQAMPEMINVTILTYINELKKVGNLETEIYDLEVVDRFEKCIVKNKEGFSISTSEQKKNLLKYYRDDKTSSYVIYYDAKTMLPLLSVSDEGFIRGWDSDVSNPFSQYDRDFDRKTDSDIFKLKIGTVYYKWSRTVKRKSGEDDGILGKTFVIDAETFPDTYKIVGETYIREQKTGKDQRYQFVIHRAQVASDTNITLEAEGDPTTFSMQIDVLTPPNDIQMELKQFDVDEDVVHGGTKIVPQKSRYTYTPTQIELKKDVDFSNPEIY